MAAPSFPLFFARRGGHELPLAASVSASTRAQVAQSLFASSRRALGLGGALAVCNEVLLVPRLVTEAALHHQHAEGASGAWRAVTSSVSVDGLLAQIVEACSLCSPSSSG